MAGPQATKSIARPAMSVALRWGLGPALVSLAFVLAQTFVFYHLPQPFTPFALSAIAGTFWYSGTKPGIFTALISWLVHNYFFEPHVIAESRIPYGLVFLIFALVVTLVRGRKELEGRVAERTAELTRTNEDLGREIAKQDELRAIVDNAPVLLWSDLPDGYCDFLNQSWLTYFNLSLQEAQGAGWATLLHPDDAAHHLENWQKSVSTGMPFETEARYRCPDGEYRWFLNRANPLRDKTGRIVKWYGTNIDIEDLKRTERRLRQSQANLAEAQRLSHTGSWALSPGTKNIFYWSEECYRIWGFDPAQGLPNRETVWRRIHPGDRDRMYQETQDALRQKRDHKVDFRIVLPDGTIKYLETIGHHLFSAQGELVEVVGTNVDVTERKRVEEALRESETKFRDYAETTSDWFWEIGPDYKFTLLTGNAFGSGAADRLGTACWEGALDLETEAEKWRLLRATLDSRQPFRDFVYCSKGSSDSPIYVRASGKPVFGANGEFRGYRGTGTDVTASMRAQEEHERLRELESGLAHLNRVSVMGELTASLVHEITQPVASARNNARAAMHFLDRNPPDLGEVREALACLVSDADRAGKIIDGVRGQVKKAPLRKDRIDLNDAIKEVIMLARAAINKHRVAVHTRLMDGPLTVEGDRVQLQQVALNLILNAIEAMTSVDTGARDLSISTEQPQPNEVLVAVRDSGPGIDPNDLERVFETFYTTKSGGTGMGLSISRSIIFAHGGRLWADVNAPRGAVFRFTLPSAAKDSRILLGGLAGAEGRAEASQQTRLVNGLPKVADDPIVERAGPVGVVGIGRDEDRRNRVSGIDEMSVEVGPGHRRHMDVSDQAGSFGETRGREKIGCRLESLDGVAQRPHEPFHRLAKQPVILDERDQRCFRHTNSGSSFGLPHTGMSSRPHADLGACAEQCRRGDASVP